MCTVQYCMYVLLDILLAVKNNNVNKIPNYDPSHFEHLKKSLKGYLR
jgi:nucleolar MIF4G domain-containing protein 1